MIETYRTWAEINLDAFKNNIEQAKMIVSPGVKIAAVLKADAYGMGALRVAGKLIDSGADMIAVACLSEALELRKRYFKTPILVMGYTPDECLDTAVKNYITLTVFSEGQALLISKAAASMNTAAKVHIKIDTGFNRLGLKPGKGAVYTIKKICSYSNINAEGIFTHLALNSREDDKAQFDMFMKTVSDAEAAGVHFKLRHVCDSIGMVRYPEYQLDMVRPGAFLFGVGPAEFKGRPVRMEMPFTLKTRISRIADLKEGEGVGYDRMFVARRDCRIGTLSAGYADGYPRSLSSKGEVIIRSKTAPVAGIVCMDQCMVDLTDIPEARPGDEAILIGGLTGPASLYEVAKRACTNKNEVLCRLGRRVPRIYYENSKVESVADYLQL